MQHQSSQSFFSRLFNKHLKCGNCLESFPSPQIESCTKCRICYSGQKVCKNCSKIVKRKILFVTLSNTVCLTCSATKRRSLSQSVAPVELSESFYSNFGGSCNMVPLKDINFHKFVEDDARSVDLPSTREVRGIQYLQDLKNLVKIQKKDPREDFEFVEKIGKGGYSKVYKALHKQTRRISALKHIKLNKLEDRERVINEIGIMQLSRHSNIIQCLTCYEFSNDFYIEMEYMDYSLSQIIKELSPKMTEKIIAYIIREILQGLSWLHRNNRIHLDIKSSNVLISKTGEVKLTDFGISRQMTKDNNEGFNIVGTPCWMAPELITSKFHDSKADIWSVGIVLIELCESEPPHIDKDKFVVMEVIANGPSPNLKNQNKWSKHLLAFFRSCVKKIPEQRSTADELLRHMFINRVGCEGRETFVEFLNEWRNS